MILLNIYYVFLKFSFIHYLFLTLCALQVQNLRYLNVILEILGRNIKKLFFFQTIMIYI